MNKNRFIVLVIAVLVLGGGIWYYTRPRHGTVPTQPTKNISVSQTTNIPTSGGYLAASTLLDTITNQEKDCLFQTNNTPASCGQGIAFFANGSKAAYVINQNGKWFLVINGTKSQPYDAIYPAAISDSLGKHAAFIAENNGEQYVILDGQQGKPYRDLIDAESDELGGGPVPFVDALNTTSRGVSYSYSNSLTFSPDGNHFAYPAHKDNKWVMVSDGAEGNTYDSIGAPLFSSDSKHIIYVATINSGASSEDFVVFDGHERKHYLEKSIGGAVFSPNNQRLAYIVTDNNSVAGNRFVVADGQEGSKYAYIGPLFFSPDSSMLAYAAATDIYNRPQFVVLNDKIGKNYFNIFDYTLVFSPDSARLSFVTQESTANQKNKVVTVDSKNSAIYAASYGQVSFRGPGFQSIFYKGDEPAYVVGRVSPESAVVADHESQSFDKMGDISASSNAAHLIYTFQRKNQWFANVDGYEMGGYDEVGYPEFSADGNHWGFSFRKNNQWTVIIDGVAAGTYDAIPSNSIIFNSLGQPAFAAKQNGKWFMIVNGKKEGSYDEIINNVDQHPIFSSQGDKVGFIARTGKQWFVVVDDNTVARGYDNILTQPVFINITELGYNAVVDNQIWWVVQ